jgi:hypothetical protein
VTQWKLPEADAAKVPNAGWNRDRFSSWPTTFAIDGVRVRYLNLALSAKTEALEVEGVFGCHDKDDSFS